MISTATAASSSALLRRVAAPFGGGSGTNRHRRLLRTAGSAAAARASSSSSGDGGSFDTDLLVVGCGIAGAASALQAARLGMRVTMLSSSPNVDDCNSFWAQGGIIYKAEVCVCDKK